MFCRKCGFELNTCANFCSNCGESVKGTSAETVSTPRTISYDEFYAKKSQERMKRFEPKAKLSSVSAKKRKFAPSSTATLSEVSINVGYMQLDNEGKLKKCRGKTNFSAELTVRKRLVA